MESNHSVFLKLLNSGLYNTCESIQCKIEDVEFESKTHICIPFIYNGAKNCNVDIPQKWNNHIILSTLQNQHNLQVQRIVLETLSDACIPCAVLKGSSVSVNYNEPLLRTLGDIDILVKPSDYDRAITVLCGDEYKDESHEGHKFHFKYTLDGVPVEIHKHVTEYSNDEYGDKIEKIMSGALDNTDIKNIDEFSFPVLSNEYQAATLLLHTQRHFYESRLPIKMLCDWAMFVRNVELKEWETVVFPFVQKMELAKFCDALTATVNRYLSAGCEEKVSKKISDQITETIIVEFLNNGVIENKDSFSQKLASSCSKRESSKIGKISSLFMLLNKIAKNEFKLARKSDVFLPLYWFYIPVRYIFRVLCGKRKRISFGVFNDSFKRKEYLINELKLKD